MHDELLFKLNNEDEQKLFGKKLADSCHHKGAVIYLQGDLGAGKTTLVRGFLNGLGIIGKIKSPTYALIENYEINILKILHIDLYRINNPEEVYALGLEDQRSENVIYLIEWPEKALTELPLPDITCKIAILDKGRVCQMMTHTKRGWEIAQALCKKF